MSAVRRRRAVTVWLLSLSLVAPALATGCSRFLDDDPPTVTGAGAHAPQAGAAASPAGTPSAGPDEFERSGRTGDLRLVLPPASTPRPYPLVIALHSLYHDGNQAKEWGLEDLARSAGFALVSPDGIGRSWNAGSCCGSAAENVVDDVGWLHSLMQHLVAKYPIDPDRIYLVGLSNGGMLAYRYACEHSAEIAGIAVVAGSLQVLGCRPQSPVSVVAVHGGKDGHVPGAGTVWQGALGTAIRSTADSLAPFRSADRCQPVGAIGDTMLTGADGAPRPSDTLRIGDATSTPGEIRAGITAAAAAMAGTDLTTAAAGAGVTLSPVDPATDPATAIRTETTCSSSARVVEYYLPELDHGWPTASGPAAFATTSVIWRLLSGARAADAGTDRAG